MFWCNVGFADAASVKKACRDLGFEPGTELFLDCALKLISQENQDDSGGLIADFFKGKEDSPKDENKENSSKKETFNEKYKTLEDVLKKLNK